MMKELVVFHVSIATAVAVAVAVGCADGSGVANESLASRVDGGMDGPGSGGRHAGGSAGSATGGPGGAADAGSAGEATGGSAGIDGGGSGGAGTGGSAGGAGGPTGPVSIATSLQSSATERSNARLVAIAPDGSIHVVYYNNGIYHSRSGDNGSTWSAPFMVTDLGRNPSIDSDSSGRIHLVYKGGGISAFDVVHRTYDGQWGAEDTVQHNEVIEVSRPMIAIDKNDEIHCVWMNAKAAGTTNSEVYYKKYASGSGWSATAENVSETDGASEYPALAVDSKRNVYVFWKDSGESVSDDKRVLHRSYVVGQGWDASPVDVSNTTGNGSSSTMEPSVLIDDSDTLHLAWTDSQDGNREIFYKACPLGDCSGAATVNVSNTSEASSKPTLSLGVGSRLLLAWNEDAGGVYSDVVFSELDNGSWSSFKNISSTAGVDSTFVNAPRFTGDGLSVVWTEGESSPYQVMFARVK